MHPQGNAAKEGMRRKPQRWRHQSQSCPRLSTSLPVFYRTSGEVGGKSEVIGAFRVVEKGEGEPRGCRSSNSLIDVPTIRRRINSQPKTHQSKLSKHKITLPLCGLVYTINIT